MRADPREAPAGRNPTQGILRNLGAIDFVGMDMVEVSPPYDSAEITSLAAASLVLDYLCLRARGLPKRAVD